MNVLKAPNHVAPTQSAETCRGGTVAAVCLVSPLPLEITGSRESQAISHAKVMLSGTGLGWTVTAGWAHVFLTLDTPSLVCSLSSTAPQTSVNASPVNLDGESLRDWKGKTSWVSLGGPRLSESPVF